MVNCRVSPLTNRCCAQEATPHNQTLKGVPVSRVFDMDKLYHSVLPLAQRLDTQKVGLWAAKAVHKALKVCILWNSWNNLEYLEASHAPQPHSAFALEDASQGSLCVMPGLLPFLISTPLTLRIPY